MKLLEITLITVWIIGTVGVMASSLISPSPYPNQNDPIAPYIVLDKPSDNRPIKGILSLDAERVLVGTDEGVYLSNPANGSYELSLPHSLWEDEQPFIAGDYIYCSVNRYHRLAYRGLKQLFRAHKDSLNWNSLNWKRITPEFSPAPDLIAIDPDRGILYGANRRGYYQSTLYSRSVKNHSITKLGDKAHLVNISAIAVFKGSLFVVANHHLYVSHDQGQHFENITSSLANGCRGASYFLTNDQFLVLNVAQHFTYVFDGKDWREITAKTVKYGTKSHYQIKALNGDKLVMSQMGIGKHQMVDLLSGEWQPIRLPKLYQYGAFELQGKDLYVSAALRKGWASFAPDSQKSLSDFEQKNHNLLRVRLNHIPISHVIWGNDMPEVIAESPSLYTHGKVINNATVYRNDGKYIINAYTQEAISKPLHKPTAFMQGKVKGHWFITHKGRLHRSDDKGKHWSMVDINLHVPHNILIDDSLNVAYKHNGRVLSRFNLNTGEVDYNNYDDFKGTIETIHLDKTGRLFVQTSTGVYISYKRGFWGCPTPFRKNNQVPVKGFALLKDHMFVTYNNRLYYSRTDILDWEEYQLCSPSNDDLHLPINIIGSDDKLIVLQELQYGHIIVLDPASGDKQRFHFPRENGAIRTAHIAKNTLIVETTGVPFSPAKEHLKHSKSAQLLGYNIHLKTQY